MARSIRRLYEIYDIRDGVNKKFKRGADTVSYPETLTLKDVANSVGLKLNTINTLISQNKTLSNQTAYLCMCLYCKIVVNMLC